MADAKVIPFDDDRSRGAPYSGRRGAGARGAGARASPWWFVRSSPCPHERFRRMMFL